MACTQNQYNKIFDLDLANDLEYLLSPVTLDEINIKNIQVLYKFFCNSDFSHKINWNVLAMRINALKIFINTSACLAAEKSDNISESKYRKFYNTYKCSDEIIQFLKNIKNDDPEFEQIDDINNNELYSVDKLLEICSETINDLEDMYNEAIRRHHLNYYAFIKKHLDNIDIWADGCCHEKSLIENIIVASIRFILESIGVLIPYDCLVQFLDPCEKCVKKEYEALKQIKNNELCEECGGEYGIDISSIQKLKNPLPLNYVRKNIVARDYTFDENYFLHKILDSSENWLLLMLEAMKTNSPKYDHISENEKNECIELLAFYLKLLDEGKEILSDSLYNHYYKLALECFDD